MRKRRLINLQSRTNNISDLIQDIGSTIGKELFYKEKISLGTDSSTFVLIDNIGMEYILKVGDGTRSDVKAIALISGRNLDVPIPEILCNIELPSTSAILMKKIEGLSLLDVKPCEIHNYIIPMIEAQKKIHKIKSSYAGPILNELSEMSWKEYLLSKFDCSNLSLNWEDISKRDLLDRDLILRIIENIGKEIELSIDDSYPCYSLLHTDFNRGNIFVESGSNSLLCILDWGEAVYGDPLFDYARIRVLLWHSKLNFSRYFNYMEYSQQEIHIENLYWKIIIAESLAYYSENIDNPRLDRINQHQAYLRTLV